MVFRSIFAMDVLPQPASTGAAGAAPSFVSFDDASRYFIAQEAAKRGRSFQLSQVGGKENVLAKVCLSGLFKMNV